MVMCSTLFHQIGNKDLMKGNKVRCAVVGPWELVVSVMHWKALIGGVEIRCVGCQSPIS